MGRRSKSIISRSSARGTDGGVRTKTVSSSTIRSRNDDRSIGSALSLKDQFDIVVPIKIPDRPCDESDVSSITTDEHRKMLKYYLRGQRTGLCPGSYNNSPTTATFPIGLCCCTEMGSSDRYGRQGGKKKKLQQQRRKQGLGAMVSVDRTCDVSRSQYSLFDALSDDDEDDDDDDRLRTAATDDQAMTDASIKRRRSWRKSLRKKMPWSKK